MWITLREVRGLKSSKLRSPPPTLALSHQAGSDRWDGVWGGREDTRQGEHLVGMNEVTGSEPTGRPSTPHRTQALLKAGISGILTSGHRGKWLTPTENSRVEHYPESSLIITFGISELLLDDLMPGRLSGAGRATGLCELAIGVTRIFLLVSKGVHTLETGRRATQAGQGGGPEGGT